MLGLLDSLGVQISLGECEWCTATLESWRQVDISWDDTSIKEREHAILDVVLCDRRWISEGIVSEVFR